LNYHPTTVKIRLYYPAAAGRIPHHPATGATTGPRNGATGCRVVVVVVVVVVVISVLAAVAVYDIRGGIQFVQFLSSRPGSVITVHPYPFVTLIIPLLLITKGPR
jgi:hypothetical protein